MSTLNNLSVGESEQIKKKENLSTDEKSDKTTDYNKNLSLWMQKKIKHSGDQKWNLSVDENDRAKQSPSTTLPIHMEHP